MTQRQSKTWYVTIHTPDPKDDYVVTVKGVTTSIDAQREALNLRTSDNHSIGDARPARVFKKISNETA